jgi:hypothetical protein
MSLIQRMYAGTWPSNDQLLAFPRNGLVCAMDAHNGNFNNLWHSPADGSSQATYNWTGLPTVPPTKMPSKIERIPGNANGALVCNGGTNTAFLNTLHRKGALFSIMCVGMMQAHNGIPLVVANSTVDDTWTAGIDCSLNRDTGYPSFSITNGNSEGISLAATTNAFCAPRSKMFFFGLSIDEAGNAGRFYLNGQTATFGATHTGTSPSGNSAAPVRIGARGAGVNYAMTPSHAVGQYAMWNRALTLTEWDNLFNAVRYRWGI